MTQLNFDDFNVISLYTRGVAEMHLNKKYVTFTRALLEEMGCPAYVRLLLNPNKNIMPMLIRPKIYCFWLSIGVMMITAATGASTSSSR